VFPRVRVISYVYSRLMNDAVKTVELIINYLSSAVIEGEARAKKRLRLRKLLKRKAKEGTGTRT